MEPLKWCRRCSRSKWRRQFYGDRRRSDGRSIYCRDCLSEMRHDWRRRNPKKWKSSQSRSQKKYQRRNRHKLNAHQAVVRALREGRLDRMPCEVCGSVRTEAHHEDYSRPLEVRWLCRTHHARVHAKV